MRKFRKCEQCQAPTRNQKFCSRSCSARGTGTARQSKRIRILKIVVCIECNSTFFQKDWSHSRCKTCYPIWKFKREFKKENLTLAMLANECKERNYHASWKWSSVRQHCRQINKNREKKCQYCGYSKHIEFAHIKPIHTFELSSTLDEVNNPSNIFILCPNCHWELDNNLLRKEDILSLEL